MTTSTGSGLWNEGFGAVGGNRYFVQAQFFTDIFRKEYPFLSMVFLFPVLETG